jgi:hypothetical protein
MCHGNTLITTNILKPSALLLLSGLSPQSLRSPRLDAEHHSSDWHGLLVIHAQRPWIPSWSRLHESLRAHSLFPTYLIRSDFASLPFRPNPLHRAAPRQRQRTPPSCPICTQYKLANITIFHTLILWSSDRALLAQW